MNLRSLIGLCAAVAAGPVPAQTLVTANMTSGSASLVDVASGRTLATIPTGEGPHEVAISHDAKWAVVSVYGSRTSIGNSLLVIDLARNAESRRIALGEYTRPHGMVFLPGDQKMLVTSEASQKVLAVDFASGKVDTTIVTGQAGTHMVKLVADGSKAFTTNVGAGSISVLDVPGRTLERTIAIGSPVEGVAVTPDGKEIWAGGRQSKLVYVVDVASGKIESLSGFELPYRLAITPDGATAVVTDPGNERIHIVDVKTRKTRAVIDVPRLAAPNGAVPTANNGASPQGVTIGPDGKTAFVTLKAAGHVVVVDLASAKIVKELVVGGGSDGIGVAR